LQKKDRITTDEVKAQSSVYFYWGVTVSLIIICLQPFILEKHSFGTQESQMLLVLAASALINSFQIIPKAQLERSLQFEKVTKIEIYESLSLYLTQIGLAFAGFGVWSFVIAFSTRATVGTLFSIYYNRGFSFSLKLDIKILKIFWNFSIFTQLFKLAQSLRNLIIPILLAAFFQNKVIGEITWVVGLASIPATLADNFHRVIFPSLSKLQESEDQFKNFATKGLEYGFLSFSIIFGLIAVSYKSFAPWLFGDKWSEIITYLPFATLAIGLSRTRYLFASIFYSKGDSKVHSLIEVLHVIIQFIISYFSIKYYGVMGYFLSLSFVEIIITIFTISKSKRSLHPGIYLSLIRYLIITLLAFLLTDHFINLTLHPVISTTLECFAFIALFFILALGLHFGAIRDTKSIIFKIVRKGKNGLK